MISIIITAYKEPLTIGKAIESIIKNELKNFEIIVIAPDKETLDVTERYSKKYKNIKLIQDSQEGKPAALNLAVSKAKGDILILTDGDVYVAEDSLKPLIKALENKEIGAVSGNPTPLNPADNQLGYWVRYSRLINPNAEVAIKGDGMANYKIVKKVMDLLIENKVTRFNLTTNLRKDDSEGKPEAKK